MVIWSSSVLSLSNVWLCDPMHCSTPGLPVHHQLTKYLKQIRKVKKPDKWVPHELKKKKKMSFWSVFSYSVQQQQTISRSDCDMSGKGDFTWKPAQWLNWDAAPKHFLKPNLHQKKGAWSLFGGLLPVWSTTTFWIPVKPLHLTSMLSKSIRCTKNCNACSQH